MWQIVDLRRFHQMSGRFMLSICGLRLICCHDHETYRHCLRARGRGPRGLERHSMHVAKLSIGRPDRSFSFLEKQRNITNIESIAVNIPDTMKLKEIETFERLAVPFSSAVKPQKWGSLSISSLFVLRGHYVGRTERVWLGQFKVSRLRFAPEKLWWHLDGEWCPVYNCMKLNTVCYVLESTSPYCKVFSVLQFITPYYKVLLRTTQNYYLLQGTILYYTELLRTARY